MGEKVRVLILGASYGSLLATKLALARHDVTMVCLPHEVEAFNRDGAIVRMPVKGRDALVQIETTTAPGKLAAAGPADVRPADFDLVVLAMQEPQYRSPGVRELLAEVGRTGVPCLSIMNMPPLPYLQRIPGVDVGPLRSAYADAAVWAPVEPSCLTLCSPDPQAFRPADEPVNVLQVRLPTNFKAARFAGDAPTAMLRQLEADIEAVRFDAGDGAPIELPVKLKVYDSVFVPLAKWSMLLAGNYRCVEDEEVRPIQEAVHGDLEATRAVYEWVARLCISLGAAAGDMVPFEKYARAALSLGSPSSVARALAAGARDVERVDRLVQQIALQQGMRSESLDATVARVDGWLTRNRARA
jgi:hypothetical protein